MTSLLTTALNVRGERILWQRQDFTKAIKGIEALNRMPIAELLLGFKAPE